MYLLRRLSLTFKHVADFCNGWIYTCINTLYLSFIFLRTSLCYTVSLHLRDGNFLAPCFIATCRLLFTAKCCLFPPLAGFVLISLRDVLWYLLTVRSILVVLLISINLYFFMRRMARKIPANLPAMTSDNRYQEHSKGKKLQGWFEFSRSLELIASLILAKVCPSRLGLPIEQSVARLRFSHRKHHAYAFAALSAKP